MGDTAHGIVVCGARVLATLAPFSDELFVYPGAPPAPGTDAYAIAFSIPMATPCRDSYSVASRGEQYERFYLASSGRAFTPAQTYAAPDRARRLLDRFLNEELA